MSACGHPTRRYVRGSTPRPSGIGNCGGTWPGAQEALPANRSQIPPISLLDVGVTVVTVRGLLDPLTSAPRLQ